MFIDATVEAILDLRTKRAICSFQVHSATACCTIAAARCRLSSQTASPGVTHRKSRFAYRHRRPHHRRPAEGIAAGTSRTRREGNRSPLPDLVCACSAGLTWLHESCYESASGRAGEWRSSSMTGPDLTVKLKGLNMPNSFVIGSVKLASVNNFALQNNVHACIIQALTMLHPGPPGTEYAVMKRAFEAGEV